GEPVDGTAQDDGQKARVAALRACLAGDQGPGKQRARADHQLAACRGMVVPGHGHLRWNSGAISSNVRACGRLSARVTARLVSADASGPNAASMTASGSWPRPSRCAKA